MSISKRFLPLLLVVFLVGSCSNAKQSEDDDRSVPTGKVNQSSGIIETDQKRQPAKERIRLSVSVSVQPYVFKADDSGFEIDIVTEAFAFSGNGIELIYQPLKRTKISFLEKKVDAVMTIKDFYPEVQGAYFSDEYITYHNYAVTLSSRNLVINNISNLHDKSIIAFQQARIAFGEAFEVMANGNPEYQEMANQQSQISMLFMGRTDVIVLDELIFEYFRNIIKDAPTHLKVNKHALFSPSHFRIAFREKKHRDEFNTGIRKLKASGRYMEIIKGYVGDKFGSSSLNQPTKRSRQ